jgi:23S rRNA pseudouridine1911/1915/1917 synthase
VGLFPKDRDLSQGLDHVVIEVRCSDFRVAPEEFELRLDAFLAHHLHWRSRSSIQALIRDGLVEIDAATPAEPRGCGRFDPERRPGRRLLHGSRVLVRIPEPLRLPATDAAAGDGLAIAYEDEDLLAVDKPPMMAVHPGGRHLQGTLIQRVHARYRRLLGEGAAAARGRLPIRLCHRIDRETSGLVLIAKDPDVHPLIMAQFEGREVEKHYLAIVRGVPQKDSGVIDLPIGSARASTVGIKMAVREDGDPSRTDWRVVERRRGCALLACRLHTGRQHQIRVHMDAIGHPLVGDKLYGRDASYFEKGMSGTLSVDDLRELELPRQALHSHRLAFTQPRSGARIEVEAPLAPDLVQFLARR